MEMIYQNHSYTNELVPKKLWNASREISRLFLSGDRWKLPFVRAQDPSPIGRLCADVLAEIFLCALCPNGFQALNARGRLPLEPLTLSHVSSRWRDVALSNPSLWTTIWVDRPREIHIPMVELWIERSRQCPLVLYLRQTSPPPPGQQPSPFEDPREYEITEKILLILGDHLHRWKRVTFFFHHHAQRSLLNLPEAPTAAPLLEHIHMTTRAWDVDSKHTMERIMYSYASVDSVVVHRNLSQEFVPWQRLTVLDASQLGCPMDSHLQVLRHCTSLRRANLCVTQNHVDTPFSRPTGRTHVAHLSSLTLAADKVDLAAFFDRIVLPKLEGLVLKYSSSPRRANDSQALHNFLVRSMCGLKRFSLRDVTTVRDDAYHLSFLRSPQMASLVELYLLVDMTDNIMKFLTLGSGEQDDPRPKRLPNLQTISLKDIRGDHVDDLELYRMVISRLSPPERDQTGGCSKNLLCAYFHLRVKGHSDSHVLPWLLERCRDRIDLRIYLDNCEDRNAKVGWYTSPPIAGGYLTDD